MYDSLSIVIPALNEQNGIASIIERCLSIDSAIKQMGLLSMEIIIVDDGSRDRTPEIVEGYAAVYPQVRLVRHPRNRGYGAALKTGFRAARGTLLAFLDADGTYPPEYYPEMCRALSKHDADIVIGSRMAGRESEMPVTRRIGNLFFATLVSLVGNRRISDSASGQRVLRRCVLEMLYPLPDGLNFTPVMSTRALHENVTMIEIPIPYQERVGRSKLKIVQDGFRFLGSILWTALGYNPVRQFGLLGIGLVGLAVIIGIGLVIARASGITELGPWGVLAVFIALMAGVAGVSIFGLGATFNYIFALYRGERIRYGPFGKPIFSRPLEERFNWFGGAAVIAGFIIGTLGLFLSLQGWPIERLWLYLLGSALSILVGFQLLISWLLLGVMRDLSERQSRVEEDLSGPDEPC
jgi:glycosyltransferase involved in cell wall biosynthesis